MSKQSDGESLKTFNHPGLGATVKDSRFHGAYEGPNSGNLWYENLSMIENYIPGAAKGKNLSIPLKQYEYLDHTADIQIHCWGKDLKEAFEQAGVALYAYMTEDITSVQLNDLHRIKAEGDDLEGLLFHFLDELLFIFSAEPFFIARKIVIETFDVENFKINAVAFGEQFDLTKHPAGTEIKAITYSAMQIYQKIKNHATTKDNVELYIIVDI